MNATSSCKVVLVCRAVPTRCKYVPVSSRLSSLTTDGRHNPAPQPASKLRKCCRTLLATRCFCRCVGRPLIRPFDARDGINDAYRDVFTACRSRGVPTQRPAQACKHSFSQQRSPVKCHEPKKEPEGSPLLTAVLINDGFQHAVAARDPSAVEWRFRYR